MFLSGWGWGGVLRVVSRRTATLLEQGAWEPGLLDDQLEGLWGDVPMLRHSDVSRDPVDDAAISPMTASLPHLDESPALKNPIDLACGEDSHG